MAPAPSGWAVLPGAAGGERFRDHLRLPATHCGAQLGRPGQLVSLLPGVPLHPHDVSAVFWWTFFNIGDKTEVFFLRRFNLE